MILELCSIVIGIYLLVKFTSSFKKPKGPFKNFEEIPYPDGLPILGNISDLFCDEPKLWKITRERALKYHPIYRTKILNFNVVSISDPDDIEMLLCEKKVTTKGAFYDTFRKWFGNGIILSEDEIWQKRRKLLTKSFHFSALRNYVEILQREAEFFVDHMRKIQGPVTIRNAIKSAMLKIICECMVGGSSLISDDQAEKYDRAVGILTKIIGVKFLKPWMMWAYKYKPSLKKIENDALTIIHDFSSELCENFQKNDSENNWKLMNLMRNAPELFDKKNIQDEIDTFIAAGHDTTKSAIQFALLALANHPEFQEEIYVELSQVLGKDDAFSIDSIRNMTFLDRFIKESLRFFAIVPSISRLLTEDIITKSGYKIPAGTTVIFQIFDIHHSPKFYEQPEKFDPDRFLPENSMKRKAYSYMPFGAGPRICLGKKFASLKMKVFICTIVRRFQLEPVETFENLQFIPDLVLDTKNELRVKFVERVDK